MMKNLPVFFTKLILVLIIPAFFLLACGKKDETPQGTLDKDTSYAFGLFLAAQAGLTDLRFDYQELMEGYRDYNEGKETRFDMDEAFELIIPALMQLQAEMDERSWIEGQRNRDEGDAFQEQNRARSGVTVTASGLQYEVITQGSGAMPGPQDTVRVHYEGSLIDGTVFDSSYSRGSPVEFPLDDVIPGWTEGLQLMNEGSSFRFVIPPEMGYGPSGTASIPPSSTLIFRVELIAIVR